MEKKNMKNDLEIFFSIFIESQKMYRFTFHFDFF